MAPKRMKAVKFTGHQQIRVVETDMPDMSNGKVLAKVLASAVCGSERTVYLRDEQPSEAFLNFGHEAVCEIVDPNGSEKWKAGDRVCVQIIPYCGECYYCKKGVPAFCINKRPGGGVACHAQYVALNENCFIPMDDDIDPALAAILGGDCMGVPTRSLRQLPVKEGDLVFVSGGGPVGLGNIFMAKQLGAKVVLSEPSEMRRKFALEHAGCDIALDPMTQDIKEELLKLTDGLGPEFTIECSGSAVAEGQALDWTRCQGHVMFCGENYKGLTIIPSYQIIHKELNLHGTFYFDPLDVPEILERYRNGMNPEGLISDIVSIDEAPGKMVDFFEGRTGGKVIIKY